MLCSNVVFYTFFRHLINCMVSIFQFTSGLCLTNQLCPRNIFMLFKSVTSVLICSLCLLISTSSSANHVTSLFLVLSVLKTLNAISAGFILICSSLTNCLLILVYVHPESTNIYSYNSFLVCVFTFVYIFSSLFLLFHQCGIIY